MEKPLRHTPRSRGGSSALSTLENGGLAVAVTFTCALWIGIALPGLPLIPGLGPDSNSENVAISLDSALLGVQDRISRAALAGAGTRAGRLFELLLPSSPPADARLAEGSVQRPLAGSLVVEIPASVDSSGAGAVASPPIDQQPAPAAVSNVSSGVSR